MSTIIWNLPLPRLSPDAVEHLGIAAALVAGEGFVDPMTWHVWPEAPQNPAPAFAMRAPLLPLLLAIPIWFGASMITLHALHAAFAGGLAIPIVLWLRRRTGSVLALLTASGLFLSEAWWRASGRLLTEALAVAMTFAVIATAPLVRRGTVWATGCAALLLLGWTARPTVLPAGLAVVVANAISLGAAFWRDRGLQVYVATCVVGVALVRALVLLGTGESPYAGYGVQWLHMKTHEASIWNRDWPNAWQFFLDNTEAIVANWGHNFVGLAEVFFVDGSTGLVGYLLPFILYWLVRAPRSAIAFRVAGFTALGYMAIVLIIYKFDAQRYPLPAAAALWMAFALGCGQWMKGVDSKTTRRAVVVAFALFVVIGLAWKSAPTYASRLPRNWTDYQTKGTRERWPSSVIDTMCKPVGRSSVVASNEPWAWTYRCGNAAMRLPTDIATADQVDAFVKSRRPDTIVVPTRKSRGSRDQLRGRWLPIYQGDLHRALRQAKTVTSRQAHKRVLWFDVRPEYRRSRDWGGIPPLFCMTRPTERCEEGAPQPTGGVLGSSTPVVVRDGVP